jgi:hypothetical protein
MWKWNSLRHGQEVEMRGLRRFVSVAEKASRMKMIYPCTILLDRYSGAYSGGKWTAFNLSPEDVPGGIDQDDLTCASTWEELKASGARVGFGSNPQEAYEDLARKL